MYKGKEQKRGCFSCKDRDVNSSRTKDREANCINNSDLAVTSDIILRLRMENLDRAWLRRMFHEGGGKVQASTSFGDDGHVDKAVRFEKSSVDHFSVGPGKKNVLRCFISLYAINFDLCNEWRQKFKLMCHHSAPEEGNHD
jgi:hypothetical protein